MANDLNHVRIQQPLSPAPIWGNLQDSPSPRADCRKSSAPGIAVGQAAPFAFTPPSRSISWAQLSAQSLLPENTTWGLPHWKGFVEVRHEPNTSFLSIMAQQAIEEFKAELLLEVGPPLGSSWLHHSKHMKAPWYSILIIYCKTGGEMLYICFGDYLATCNWYYLWLPAIFLTLDLEILAKWETSIKLFSNVIKLLWILRWIVHEVHNVIVNRYLIKHLFILILLNFLKFYSQYI